MRPTTPLRRTLRGKARPPFTYTTWRLTASGWRSKRSIGWPIWSNCAAEQVDSCPCETDEGCFQCVRNPQAEVPASKAATLALLEMIGGTGDPACGHLAGSDAPPPSVENCPNISDAPRQPSARFCNNCGRVEAARDSRLVDYPFVRDLPDRTDPRPTHYPIGGTLPRLGRSRCGDRRRDGPRTTWMVHRESSGSHTSRRAIRKPRREPGRRAYGLSSRTAETWRVNCSPIGRTPITLPSVRQRPTPHGGPEGVGCRPRRPETTPPSRPSALTRHSGSDPLGPAVHRV